MKRASIGTEVVLRRALTGYPIDRIQRNRSGSWDVYVDESHCATVRTEGEARMIASDERDLLDHIARRPTERSTT